MNTLSALWFWLRAQVLRYQIYETEMWLAACTADGIFDGVSLRYIRADLSAMRVKLIDLESSASKAWARAKGVRKPAAIELCGIGRRYGRRRPTRGVTWIAPTRPSAR